MSSSEDFYDSLAEYYKLIYHDWDRSVTRQAEALDVVIRQHFGTHASKVLDAACGVGTQAIGLAELGYQVVAGDISSRALSSGELEASKRGLAIEWVRADMRELALIFERSFDVVIACDNSVPHLLSDEDILKAFRSFHELTQPRGGAIISVRDYGSVEKGGVLINPRRVHQAEGVRTILFDTWEFEGQHYQVTIYIVEDDGEVTPQTKAIRGGRYYAVPIERLVELFTEAGFGEVFVLKEAFFQPVLVAKKSY